MKKTPHLSIKEWDSNDKPREKMLQHGKKNLSNAELIAILLRSGNAEHSALDLAKQLLSEHSNSLSALSLQTPQELMKTKGIKMAKATSIAAALELGRRLSGENQRADRDVVKTSADLYGIIAEKISGQPTEEFWAIYMNTRHRVVGTMRISAGGITHTAVDTRLIFKGAIEHNATTLAVAHNHPSGSLKPSPEDNQLTRRIAEAGKLLDIRLVDHLIVGNGGLNTNDYYSYNDDGRL